MPALHNDRFGFEKKQAATRAYHAFVSVTTVIAEMKRALEENVEPLQRPKLNDIHQKQEKQSEQHRVVSREEWIGISSVFRIEFPS